jgi:hypothetical protein
MRTITEDPIEDGLEPDEVDRFTKSLAPINHTRAFSFGLIERCCCLGVLVTALALMRLFLAK